MIASNQVSRAIAFVHADACAEQRSLGIALLVTGSGDFVTCAHVVAGRKWVTLRSLNGDLHVAEVDIYPEVDLAVLRAGVGAIARMRPCPIISTAEISDCYLYVLLDPAGGELTPHQISCTAGAKSTIRYKIGEQSQTLTDVYALPGVEISSGHSGAPVWSRRHSAVVGLAVASRNTSAIATFLTAFSSRRTPESIHRVLLQNSDATTRTGVSPNSRGLKVLARLACGRSSRALRLLGLFDEERVIPRTVLSLGLEAFSSQRARPLLVIVSGSGLGKTSSIFQWLQEKHSKTAFFARGVAIKSPNEPVAQLFCPELGGMLRLGEGEGNPRYLIVDGLNESICPYEALVDEWLPAATFDAESMGFHLIVTMRLELWSLAKQSLSLAEKLFAPMSLGRGDLPNRSLDVVDNKCLILGLFDRHELTLARRSYGVHADLPDSILSHPFLLKLAASKTIAGARILNRYELLHAYLGAKITLLARRVNLLEAEVVRLLGQDVSSLGHRENRAMRLPASSTYQRDSLLRACIGESLIEETESGYRFVFDYCFDYFLMRDAWSCLAEGNDSAVFAALTVEAAGLMIERADGEKDTDLCSRIEGMLHAMATSSEYSQQRWALAVLSKVRANAFLSRMKDEIFHGDAFTLLFRFGFVISFEGFDLGPYAWSEKQALALIARMIEQEGDYGWRPQDLEMPERGNYASNRYSVRRLFGDYQVLSPAFLEVLVEKLADSERVGRESSIASFHGHVLAALADKFGVEAVIKRIVELDSDISQAIIVRTAVDYPQQVAQHLGYIVQSGPAGVRVAVEVLLAFAEKRSSPDGVMYPSQEELLPLVPLLIGSEISISKWARCFDWKNAGDAFKQQVRGQAAQSLLEDPWSASVIWDCFVPHTLSVKEYFDRFESGIVTLPTFERTEILKYLNLEIASLCNPTEQKSAIERLLAIFAESRNAVTASQEGRVIDSLLYTIDGIGENASSFAKQLLVIQPERMDEALREVAFFAFNSRNVNSRLARQLRFYILRRCTVAARSSLLAFIVAPRGDVMEPRRFTQQLELTWLLRRIDAEVAIGQAQAARALGVHRGRNWWGSIVDSYISVYGAPAEDLALVDG